MCKWLVSGTKKHHEKKKKKKRSKTLVSFLVCLFTNNKKLYFNAVYVAINILLGLSQFLLAKKKLVILPIILATHSYSRLAED